MKAIFYKSILSQENLTPTDRIVYSQILYLSLMEKSNSSYDLEGRFNLESANNKYGGYVPVSWRVSGKYICEILRISRKQYYLSFANLNKFGYLISDTNNTLVKLTCLIPYFELDTKTKLRGYELIVYSYLLAKSAKYGWVDKYHDAIAKDLSLSRISIEQILHKLYKKGFLERMRRGHQVLLRPIKKDVQQV